MALLKAIVAKIDDVEERFRDLYAEKKDAKGASQWVIDIDGVKTPADVENVTKALQSERVAHKNTSDKLKVATDAVAAFGEMTPDQVTELSEKLATLEAAGTPELTKNFEKIVTDRVAAVLDGKVKAETAKKDKLIGELQAQLGETAKAVETYKVADQHRTIDDAVRAAASKAKVLDGAMVDALIRARTVFTIQDGKVVTAEGLAPEDWIEKRKEDAGHWWPLARGTGAHGSDGQGNFSSGDNPFMAKSWNMTKQGEIMRADPAKAQRMADAAGVKPGDSKPAPQS